MCIWFYIYIIQYVCMFECIRALLFSLQLNSLRQVVPSTSLLELSMLTWEHTNILCCANLVRVLALGPHNEYLQHFLTGFFTCTMLLACTYLHAFSYAVKYTRMYGYCIFYKGEYHNQALSKYVDVHIFICR